MKIVQESIEVKIINEPIYEPAPRSKGKWFSIFFKKKQNKKMNIKFPKFTKVLIGLLAAIVMLAQNPLVYVLAFDIPSAPTAPTPPPEPETTITPPPEPTAPPEPTLAVAEPTAPPQPTLEEAVNDDNAENNEGTEASQEEENNASEGSTQSGDTTQNTGGDFSGQVSDGQVGDTHITTGDATNSSVIATDANSNLSATPGSSSGGITIGNTGNGSESDNSGSASIVNNNNTIQDNDASVTNNLDQSSVTGSNSASNNVGNSKIETGDANTSATVITAVNTNVDGVMVAEFNVADDYTGDIILDFGLNCISGCPESHTTVINSGNGTDSNNSGDVNQVTNNNTFQTNDAVIENNVILGSNSGDNAADANTGGNSEITTGDANTQASVLNFANNNFAGEVVYAVVNVFGDLVGDIIFPDGSILSCCATDLLAKDSGNGTGSDNTASIDQTTNDNTFQFNDADIENNLLLSTTTGGNSISENTGGDGKVVTGDSSIVAQVLNIANLNLTGGNYWLVLVNEAGQWIGRILGAPDGSNVAGSEAFSFVVDENGEIAVINSGNGSGSVNNGNVNQETNSTIYQTNDARIVNNLDLSANTGGNSASRNTGGDSSVTTGDANIVANIVNFVNNNIVGTGKLFVTVVNVFGSWIGDFVSPGHENENNNQENQAGVGGTSSQQGSSGASSAQNESDNDNALADTSSVSNVSPKPKKTLTVLGSVTSALGSLGSDLLGNQETGVSGSGLDSSDIAGKKVVKVNLAYLLLLLPALLVLKLVRKRYFAEVPAKS